MSIATSGCDDADRYSFLAPYYEPLIAEPPLKGKGYLTVGYGDSESVPHSFFLREGQKVDVGILKLFLSREQVNLSHVAQSSPFVPVEDHSTASSSLPFTLIGGRSKNPSHHTRLYFPWDTVEVPVVQQCAPVEDF